MPRIDQRGGIFEGVDKLALLLYVLLVLAGGVFITASSYDEASPLPFWDFSHHYVKQIMWIGIAFVTGMAVLLLDDRFYHMCAHYFYFGGLLVLAGTLVFGIKVNGATAWYEFGSIRVQPVEFVKIATALMMARVMSEYSFSIERFGDLCKVAVVLLIPMGIIVIQNDTGSGVVLGSFLFVLYREGLNKWLCIPVLVAAALFILSIVLTPIVLLMMSILVCTLSEAMMTGEWKSRIIFLASVFLASFLLYFAGMILFPGVLDGYRALLCVTVAAIVFVGIYAYRANINRTFMMLAVFLGSLMILSSAGYIISRLPQHQQNRIKSYLGIVIDPAESAKLDYNVNQSKIAIGSGGMFGKGFLQGTQVKYGFVPERHTDFIFCSVGEEWGFVGALVVLSMLCALILRLIHMGERQEEPFGRIYCYCVAAILLFHMLVNVGMTIGLVPVMGIPLPLISYGGSSLVAFTILIFIAFRLDASTRQFSLN